MGYGNTKHPFEDTLEAQRASEGFCLTLTPGALDFVRHFFLRYYRDGVAEVDHIDVQNCDGGYTTICAQDSAPAVSEKEAKRRLGLD
jgi:hypothetical protein